VRERGKEGVRVASQRGHESSRLGLSEAFPVSVTADRVRLGLGSYAPLHHDDHVQLRPVSWFRAQVDKHPSTASVIALLVRTSNNTAGSHQRHYLISFLPRVVHKVDSMS
jgi:hypothetical protein